MSRHPLFLLIPVLLVLFCSEALAAGPKMELSTEIWEMGNIYQWDNPSTEISIKNSGDNTLVISDVKTSCGCTAVMLSEKSIEPGKAGTLKISFDPYNITGPVRREVGLVTNDKASPKKNITVRGRVMADKAVIGSIDPDYLDFGVIAPYDTKFFVVNIRNKGNADMVLSGIDLPKGCFFDSAEPVRAPARGSASVRVGYRPTKSSGPVNEELTVKTTDTNQKEFKLKLVGYIAESVRGSDALIITPSALKVSPDAKSPAVGVALKNEGKGRVLVEGAESSFDSKDPEITNQELKPGESARVNLPLKPESLSSGTKGYLYIRVAIPIEVDTGNK
jgi:P pilus assembly chaperone PapD